jgi:sulfate/thiosulfate transport system substrate-binding protein
MGVLLEDQRMTSKHWLNSWIAFLNGVLIVCVTRGCNTGTQMDSHVDTLVLGAYTVPKEAYQTKIIPAFQAYWKKKSGRDVVFEESYVGSGAQSRAIVGGFEADIAALSLEGDVDRIAAAGLITHDWKNQRWDRFITRSVVVIGYRPGNPRGIHDWKDLTRDDIDLLCANPKTSGGAQWFVNAIYGSVLKTSEMESGTRDGEGARLLLRDILKRVKVMNKSARESVTTYERGIGDAILTYENEAKSRQLQGRAFPFVVPDATILIENPVAVVDIYADKHGVRELAEEFVRYLHSDASQRAFAENGFRPVSTQIAKEFESTYPVPEHLFDIRFLGGWEQVGTELYGDGGLWQIITREINREMR